MGDTATLDQRRRDGLCATCAKPLTERERALEGVGGSYVRCDDCVNDALNDASFPDSYGAAEA
jgi:hypothetical protein